MLFALIFAGCESRDTLKYTYEYQKMEQAVDSGVQYLSGQASDLIQNNNQVQNVVSGANEIWNQAKDQTNQRVDKAKEEAQNQYDQFKQDVKDGIKEGVNEKISQTLDKR